MGYWEKKWKNAKEWCKEHWKAVVTGVLVLAAIAVVVLTAGAVAILLAEAAKGLIAGALTGALFGGIGGGGQVLGKSCSVLKHLGNMKKVIPTASKVFSGISLAMAGFDMLSLGVSLFDSKSPLVQFNKKLHESSLYNGFQITVSTLAIFTAGFTKGMKNPICFVAGTMVLTAVE